MEVFLAATGTVGDKDEEWNINITSVFVFI